MEDQNKTEGLFNLNLDSEGRSLLKTTIVWAKIVAIIAFVQAGISLATSFMGKSNSIQMAGSVSLTIFIILISVLLNIFLYRFAQKTGDALSSSNQQSFIDGISSLRNYFKIFGIVIIVLMSLFIIAVIFIFISFAVAR